MYLGAFIQSVQTGMRSTAVMQSLVDAMNFIDANSYGQRALNYSTGTLPCIPFFPLTPENLTSTPSPLTEHAILCESLISFDTKLSYLSVPWTHFVSMGTAFGVLSLSPPAICSASLGNDARNISLDCLYCSQLFL